MKRTPLTSGVATGGLGHRGPREGIKWKFRWIFGTVQGVILVKGSFEVYYKGEYMKLKINACFRILGVMGQKNLL